jgi:hypothetical protein
MAVSAIDVAAKEVVVETELDAESVMAAILEVGYHPVLID